MAYIKDNPNTRTAGEWCGIDLGPEDLIPAGGILDITKFGAQDAVSIVVSGAAIATATSIPVTALVDPLPTPIATYTPPLRVLIPSGSLLYFGGQKIAQTTADAKAGDTAIACVALPTALAGGETYTFPGTGKYSISVPSGYIVGRTIAERDAGTAYRPALTTDDEIYLVAFDIPNLLQDASATLVKSLAGVVVYEDKLPQYPALNTAVTEVQTVTINGALSAGVIIVKDGKGKEVSMAYNANQAAIQAAYDTLYGAGKTVITGTVASYTVTYSGTGFAGVAQTQSAVDASDATGFTNSTVVRTTPGGKALLEKIRTLFKVGVSWN